MLRLRPYKRADARRLLRWPGGRREFEKWCAGQFLYPLTEGQLEDYFERCEADLFAWPMTGLDEQGNPVGHILLRNADYEKGAVHFGFIIMDPGLRGRGLGRELLTGALSYAFAVLKVEKATLGVFENNPAAHSCYLSAGFHDVKTLPERFFYEGEQWKIIAMECDKKDWILNR